MSPSDTCPLEPREGLRAGPAAVWLVWFARVITGFGIVSGIGWLLDFAIFASLAEAGLRLAVANFLGASVAVTFVYFASVRHVFRYAGGFLYLKFALYVAYQVLAITAASIAVEGIARAWGMPGIWAKIIVTPLTFGANFLFMLLLVGRRPDPGARPAGSIRAAAAADDPVVDLRGGS
ncbi:MAG: GtrA family protein [Planctomycetota bacterium]